MGHDHVCMYVCMMINGCLWIVGLSEKSYDSFMMLT